MSIYTKAPVNKTTALIVNQSGCSDKVESSLHEIHQEGMNIRNKIDELAQKIGMGKVSKGRFTKWKKANKEKADFYKEEIRQLGVLFGRYKTCKLILRGKWKDK